MFIKVEPKEVVYTPVEGMEGAYVGTIFAPEQTKNLGAGIFQMDKQAFDITYTYDEVTVIISGQVKITVDGKTHILNRGDIGYFSKGTKVHFESDGICESFNVTYPIVTDELLAEAFGM